MRKIYIVYESLKEEQISIGSWIYQWNDDITEDFLKLVSKDISEKINKKIIITNWKILEG